MTNNKARLTITLSPDVLEKVDSLVNGVTVRNRSHAIETLIKKSLSPSVTTAVVLAGGRYKDINPALKEIGGTYLLAYLIEYLKKHHINHVVICINSEDTEIISRLGNGSDFGIRIDYSVEERKLGTGGALKKAKPFLKNAPFLVIHGDTVTNLNLTDLFEFHFREKTVATTAVKPRMSEEKYGQAFIQGNRIIRFLPSSEKSGISIVNTGLYVFEPNIFNHLPNKESFTLEKDVFPILAEKKQLSASLFQGIWYDITTDTSYKTAQQRWNEIVG